MIKRLINKKIVATITIFIFSLSLTACGKPKPVQVPKNPKQKVEDKAMTKKIEKEKFVDGSKVYISGDTIVATMIIKKDTPKGEGEKIAKQYGEELKKEYKNLQEDYKGMKINVQAVQNGENIANILIEK